MVRGAPNADFRRSCSPSGFALAELLISTTIFAAVTASLLMGFVSLKRNYAATVDFAINHADQMRISDYLAMDLRRAQAVQSVKNDASIFIPCYYGSSANPSPQTPTLDGAGGVLYGAAGCSVRVRYYLSGGTIYRQYGDEAPSALAVEVQDFEFNATDLGKVVNTSITFRPTFRSAGASVEIKNATAFHNTTLLRNSRTDIQSGVY